MTSSSSSSAEPATGGGGGGSREKSGGGGGGYMHRIRDKRDAMKPLLHLMLGMLIHIMANMMAIPVLTDVFLEALCPGQNECSQAIFLSGVQQVVSGIGTMLVTPILGELSDEYGRKPMLMIPFTAAVLPISVLAYSRTKAFVYAYMIIGGIVKMFSDGGLICLAFAYVGDTVEERFRALAIGVLMASFSTGYVLGILLARVLPEAQIFGIAAVLIAFAAIYLKIFLAETNYGPPLLPQVTNQSSEQRRQKPAKCRSTPLLMRSTSSITETVMLFKQNKLLTQVAIIVFFSNLGESGVQSSLLYYLKASFSFGKDQFAELMLITGIASVISQLAIMPFFVHFLGEKLVLCLGLSAAFVHALLYGLAWARWVPYFCSSLSLLLVFVFPSIGSIISKAAGPEEQGKLQGFVAGIKSFATIISPLVISPLTALFLSERAPFKCPGFSIICAAIVMVVALVQAFIMEPPPPAFSNHKASKYVQVLAEDALQAKEPLAEPLLHPLA